MTVTATDPVSGPHVADGINRDWQFKFKVDNVAHMALRITDADGTNEVLVFSGFTIAANYLNNNAGGYVNYPVSPAAVLDAGKIVYPYRVVPYEQPTAIGNQGGFFPQTHERALDYGSMQIQQLKSITDRALVVPVGEAAPSSAEFFAMLDEAANDASRSEAARDLAEQYAAQAPINNNVPIYSSYLAAAASTIVAGIKNVRTQFRSPLYAQFATLNGGAYYSRISGASLAGYPTSSYFRSVDRFMPDGTTDNTNGGYWLLSEPNAQAYMFGARCDGTTDDTAALQAYADYLAMISDSTVAANSGLTKKRRPIFRIPHGLGARITSQLVIGKNINVYMDGPILVDVAAGASGSWVVISPTAVANTGGRNIDIEIDVRRVTMSDWSNDTDIGCECLGTAAGRIKVKRADNFYYGVKACIPYSQLELGEFRDCRWGLWLVGTAFDFSNQMLVLMGEFAHGSGIHPNMARGGIRVSHTGGGAGARGNALTFIAPSFEMADATAGVAECLPFLIEDMGDVKVIQCRTEHSSGTLMRLEGDCRWCVVETHTIAESAYPRRQLMVDNSTYKIGNKVVYGNGDYDFTKAYQVFDSGNLCNGLTRINAAGWHFRDLEVAVNTDPCTFSVAYGATVVPNHKTREVLLGTQYIGTRIDCRDAKTFALVIDGSAAKNCGVIVMAFDAAGNQLTATGDVLRNEPTAASASNVGAYGGFYTIGVGSNRDQHVIALSANAAYFFVGIAGGTLKSFRVYANEGSATAFNKSMKINKGARLAFSVPADAAAGHYERGTLVWSPTPAAATVPGWMCVSSGQLLPALVGVTANTTAASRVVVLNDVTNLAPGFAITIAGVTGTKVIEALEGNTAFVDTACDATVAAAAVAHVAPVFKAMAALAA